jgi:hypothetical protein
VLEITDDAIANINIFNNKIALKKVAIQPFSRGYFKDLSFDKPVYALNCSSES